ncbi:MAG: hypothetical protein L0221_17100 [Chloroflexi bacterium]|nr:hypothetical protein [Chloroflexota bacterium]
MIERLLEAERARAAGELDLAAELLGQVVEADPRNAIAVVGLARVAQDRGDLAAAEAHAHHALELDPDEAAAQRILDELQRAATASAADAEPATEPDVPEPKRLVPVAEQEPPPPSPAPTAPRRHWLQRLLDRVLGRR